MGLKDGLWTPPSDWYDKNGISLNSYDCLHSNGICEILHFFKYTLYMTFNTSKL